MCDEDDTPISETFYGTDAADTIKLQAGSDNLYCATPTVYGGSGDDDILGSRTLALNYLETLYGGTGADVIRGDAGVDTIYGDAGPDTLFGGDDDDFIYGGADNDKIKGDDGDDYIEAESGADQACGGPGEDETYGGDGNDSLFDGVGTYALQIVDGGGHTTGDSCGNGTYAQVTSCESTITSCPW